MKLVAASAVAGACIAYVAAQDAPVMQQTAAMDTLVDDGHSGMGVGMGMGIGGMGMGLTGVPMNEGQMLGGAGFGNLPLQGGGLGTVNVPPSSNMNLGPYGMGMRTSGTSYMTDIDRNSPHVADDANAISSIYKNPDHEVSGAIQDLTSMGNYPFSHQIANANNNDAIANMQSTLEKMYDTVAKQKESVEQQQQAVFALENLVRNNQEIYMRNQNSTAEYSEKLNTLFTFYSMQMRNLTALGGLDMAADKKEGGKKEGGKKEEKKAFLQTGERFHEKLQRLKGRVNDE